ncbi:MAG: hypothetical protein KBS82_05015 [Oscillospiraceae bacterium]|nr:hypothetical protein [Candidatus Limimonas egerieequi]
MTNREMLNNMSNEELAYFIMTKLLSIGKSFNNSIAGISFWLGEEYDGWLNY